MLTTSFLRAVLLLLPVAAAAQWMPRNTGLPNTQGFVHGVNTVAQSDSALFAATNTELLRSLDEGATWTDVTASLPAGVRIDVVTSNGSTVFVTWHTTPGVASGGMHRSADHGATWEDTDVSIGGNYIVALHAAGDTIVAYAPSPRLILSTDGGATWSEGPTPPGDGQAIIRMGADIYLGTEDSAYRATGLGANWTQLPGITGTFSFAVDGNALYAGTRPAVLRTTDSGATWATMRGTMPSLSYTRSIYADGGTIVVSSSGAYASHDSGATWVEWNEGFPNGAGVGTLVAHGDYLYAATSGVYRRSLAEPVAVAPGMRSAGRGEALQVVAGPAGSGIIRLLGAKGTEALAVRVFTAAGVETFKATVSGGMERDGYAVKVPAGSPRLLIVQVTGDGVAVTRRLLMP